MSRSPLEQSCDNGSNENIAWVSGRFLTDLLRTLERAGQPGFELLGDLPIPRGERGEIPRPVEWAHFAEILSRLGRAVGGGNELQKISGEMGPMAPGRALSGLAGWTAPPDALYRAAAGWALRRALPAVDAKVEHLGGGQLEIVARTPEHLRACPELFHFAAGASRSLPRLIGLRDAVVQSEIGERTATYRIHVPPSRTLVSRLRRIFKTITSAGEVLRFLEMQQLELHAKNEALERANADLAASERRYRTLAETAVDVLCEIDHRGRVAYVSPSVLPLIGYSPAQVTDSHYRLWLPQTWHDRADRLLTTLLALPEGRAVRSRMVLRAASAKDVEVEFTARTYDGEDGQRRIVAILRDVRAVMATEELAADRGAERFPTSSADLDGLPARASVPERGIPLPLDVDAVVEQTLDHAPALYAEEEAIDAPAGAFEPERRDPQRKRRQTPPQPASDDA